MESTIKVQQVEDRGEYFKIHYDLNVKNERLRRTVILDPFDVETTTESDIATMISDNENADEINKEFSMIKENKADRYYPDANGNLVSMAGADIRKWKAGISIEKNVLYLFKGQVYIAQIAHTSQEDWTPDVVNMFAKAQILNDDTPPEWVQPTGSGGPDLPYPANAVVAHSGSFWQSDVDNNVWEPGVSQWTEVEKDANGNWVPV